MNPPTVECPECNGSGAHRLARWIGDCKCTTCGGSGQMSRALFDTLVAIGVEMQNADKRRRALQDHRVLTGDVLGVPTDFVFSTEHTKEAVKLTVSYIPPRVRYDVARGTFIVSPPAN